MNLHSTSLFASTSFLEGLARVLDIGGTLNVYNTSLTERQADFWALYNDWRAVGQDIRDVASEEHQRLLHEGDGNVGRG